MRCHIVIMLSLLLFMSALPLAAADVVTVKGESTFYGEGSHSLDFCRQAALEQARIAALAKEFGTSISQDIYQRDRQGKDGEESYFSMLNLSEVNGEWLGDIGEPEYKVEQDANHHYVVTCVVKGKARKLTNESTPFEALVLRNGNEQRFADTRFRDGDDMRLWFRTPVAGYIAVYFIDDKRNVYSILPYQNGTDGLMHLSRDKDYVFFDPSKADPQFGEPDELTMTLTNGTSVERNQFYVLFSPERFNRALDHSSSPDDLRTLSYEEFTKWLAQTRRRDPKMGMKVINIEVAK